MATDLEKGRYWSKSYSLVTGCSPIGGPNGPCAHCWARALTNRFPAVHGTFEPTFHADRIPLPDWRIPQVVFASIMGDWLHERCVTYAEFLMQVSAMASRPRHQFLTCTKRPERLVEYWLAASRYGALGGLNKHAFPPNVWLGTTIWNDDSARASLDGLVKLPAYTWVSAEPLLGRINVDPWVDSMGLTLDWVTVGAETGGGRRNADPDWFRRIIDACQSVVRPVPVWVKAGPRIGGGITHRLDEMPEWARVRQLPPKLARILLAPKMARAPRLNRESPR